MEDTLGAAKRDPIHRIVRIVLILVLMEDTLGVSAGNSFRIVKVVLILVLMEDTLGEDTVVIRNEGPFGLNPCFNGRYSRSSKAIQGEIETLES